MCDAIRKNSVGDGNPLTTRIPPLIAWATIGLPWIIYGLAFSPAVADTEVPTRFNTDFLIDKNGIALDLSRFERGSPLTPRRYRLDIYINKNSVGIHEVILGKDENDEPYFCFKPESIASLGIDRPLEEQAGDHCIDIQKWVPYSRVEFEQSNLRLQISIPQAYLRQFDQHYVSPDRADAGVMAAFIDYNTNAWRASSNGHSQTQYYAGINTGLNLSHWRLRHNGFYNQNLGSMGAQRKYASISSYLQRDVAALKAQLTLGQYYTAPDLFDSIAYSGIQLASDDRMLPDSQRGFAPTIHGTAETNAQITVRQGDNILYKTSVAPGPFVIDKLYGGGYAGDMAVTVTEADGRQSTFTVPFATVPQLLRPAVARYNLVLGKYRNDRLSDTPEFLQGTYQRGFSNLWTGYTGGTLSQHYMAAQMGLALSTGLGAFAVDVTQSDATIPVAGNRERVKGQSYRFTYSKLLEPTQTNFTVASYRFSSKGYYSFTDYAQLAGSADSDVVIPARQRSRVQANISQTLPAGFGSLYLSGSIQNYWTVDKGRDMTYQLGYSNAFAWGSFNLSAGRSRSAYGGDETQYILNFSVPLGRSVGSPFLTTSLAHSAAGGWNAQTGISGSLGEEDLLSYGSYASRSYNNNTNSYGGNAQYRADNAILTASTSQGSAYSQYGIGALGSVVIHPGGITLSQAQGETKAVVSAPGAHGASLLNSKGVRIGSRGYAVTAGLIPYRENTVMLEPKEIPDNIELKVTEQRIAPRYGAIVMLDYPTISGNPVLLVLRDETGHFLPLGAEVFDHQGNSVTFVGQGSRVFMRITEPHGYIKIHWGQGRDRQCQANYSLPDHINDKNTDIVQLTATCRRTG